MSGRRMKRVTDPLNDKAKARIVGSYLISGSEHSAAAQDDDGATLSDLFFGFNILDDSPPPDSIERLNEEMLDSIDRSVELIDPILQYQGDSFKNVLTSHVSKALQVFAVKSSKQVMCRNVMAFLRGYGYNVGVCKTKWESNSGGLTSGNYEFIDVVESVTATRYFVDLDFASEFEIARPTDSYERLLQCLPMVFVGHREELKVILKVMSEAAKRSLKSRDLHLPPWRKHRFMQNKWFAQYRRTTNLFPASFSAVDQSFAGVKCRTIGFDAAVNGGGLLTTRTS